METSICQQNINIYTHTHNHLLLQSLTFMTAETSPGALPTNKLINSIVISFQSIRPYFSNFQPLSRCVRMECSYYIVIIIIETPVFINYCAKYHGNQQ